MRSQNGPAKAKVLNMHTKPIKRPFDKCLQENCRENEWARDGPATANRRQGHGAGRSNLQILQGKLH